MPNLFLGLTGSVASVKIFSLLRSAHERGFNVRWHATVSAQPFVLKALARKLTQAQQVFAADRGEIAQTLRDTCVRCDCRLRDAIYGQPTFDSFIKSLETSERGAFARPVISAVEPLPQIAAFRDGFVEGTDKDGILEDEKGHVLHVNTAQWADVVLIAPASANTLAKIAYGITDNFLLDVVRAVPRGRRVFIAPAMNTEMWFDPAVQAALHLLESPAFRDKYRTIPPIEKELQCGTTGIGAMEEPPAILAAVAAPG